MTEKLRVLVLNLDAKASQWLVETVASQLEVSLAPPRAQVCSDALSGRCIASLNRRNRGFGWSDTSFVPFRIIVRP
ncbi:hypothetical protein ABBQ32_008025 [Trebouxia sp. C0010 RCD-2024]